MSVAKVKSGNVITYTGTSAEVAQALSDDQVPEDKYKIVYDAGASKFVAFVKVL